MFREQIPLKNGQWCTIREAEGEDAGDLIRYIRQVAGETDYLTFGPDEFDLSVEEQRRMLEEYRQSPRNLFLVAEVDGVIVAALDLRTSNRKRIRHAGTFGISVARDYWGQGIGSACLKAMIDWAKATGEIRKINLKVRKDHLKAIALYQQIGFAVEGIITRYFFIDGKFYDALAMGLAID